MDYEELELYIRPGKKGFEVEVRDAPIQGGPRQRSKAPMSEAELADVLPKIEWRLCAESVGTAGNPAHHCVGLAKAAGVAPDAWNEFPDYEDLGEKLFRALFPRGIESHFLACRGSVGAAAGVPPKGLRIRLVFASNDAEHLGPLAAQPWELIRDPARKEFLSQNPSLPLVRRIDAPLPKRDLLVEPPLRILLVAPKPTGAKGLDLEKEENKLAEALGKRPDIGLFALEKPTLQRLRRALRNQEAQGEGIHVVHYMGHGNFDEGPSGLGYLFFENEDGSEHPVDAEQVAGVLRGLRDLRLVFLNACRGAETPRRRGIDPFKGVATILSLYGVPAVVAMQFSISDCGAITFAEEFYTAVAEGRPVEEAVAEGRIALEGSTREWLTPVLFLKAEDGRLVKPHPVSRRGPAAGLRRVSPATEREPERLHVGIRSVAEWGIRMGKDIAKENLLLLESSFDGRKIREPGLWQSEVFPRLAEFLRRVESGRQPLLLDFAAHQSLAFAAGWCLDAKSGLDIIVRQRGLKRSPEVLIERSFEWSPTDGTEPEGALWQPVADVDLDPDADDIALAVAITHPNVVDDVVHWKRTEAVPLHRIIPAVIAPQPASDSVQGGAHALALAQKLAFRARTRTLEERSGRLHILGAAPNAFFFYLGQLARSFGPIILYEFNFDRPELKEYWPSIELPPPERRES